MTEPQPHTIRKLPADVARCRGNGCTKRESCLRAMSPPHGERQVWIRSHDVPWCASFVAIVVDDYRVDKNTSNCK